MAILLRKWLEGADLSFFKHKAKNHHLAVKTLELESLAFELATADEISETLPNVIHTLQTFMQEYFSNKQRCDLYVLFSSPSTAESFLHHAQEEKPSRHFINELHRTFTQNSAPKGGLIQLNVRDRDCHIVCQPLLENTNLDIWLLLSFPEQMPDLEKVKWYLSPIEQGLTKGITAWYRREEKIKSALKDERAIYAAELHDSIAQVLGYLRIKSAKLDKLCQQTDYQALKPITEDLSAYTLCAYRQTRELITSSRLTIQADNLSQGVVDSIQEFEQQSAIVFELDNRFKQSSFLRPKQSLQVLYIIRESLSNIVRHSHATHSKVLLHPIGEHKLQVVIEDNGIGIDPENARNDSFGLQIMRERAERIGAKLTINSPTDGGTRTELLLDLGEHRE